jgi:hypothetical protein
MIKEVEIDGPTGDLAMKLAITNLPMEVPNVGPWNHLEGKGAVQNFSGKTNLTFEMYVESGSNTNLMIVPVFQLVSSEKEWHWSPAHTASFMLADKPVGQWFLVSIPITAFQPDTDGATPDYSKVQRINIQYIAKDAPFTGTIYFDNIGVDGTVIHNFNQLGDEWSTEASEANVTLAARPGGSVSISTANKLTTTIARAPVVTVRGKVLNVTGINNTEAQVKIINMRGKTIANFNASGNAQFSLAKIPAGRYIVETRSAGKRIGSSAVIVK